MPAIEVLGPVRARRDGDPIDIGGRRQQVILAILAAVGPDGLSVDALVEELWPDDGNRPGDPVATLRTYVARLRRAIGDHAVVTLPGATPFTPTRLALTPAISRPPCWRLGPVAPRRP